MTATLPETGTDVVLSVRDLVVEITVPRREPIRPVRGVSFDVRSGRRLGIVGESGSGKSLTALSLMRLLPPRARIAAGHVLLRGNDLAPVSEREMARVRGGQISTVYQDPMSSLNPLMTVGRQITEAIAAHEGVGRREARERAIQVLGDVGLPQPERRIDDHPHQFSGGMRQRVMIAMAICTNPDVLIADEPTTALDVTTQARIMEMLGRIVEERRMGVILITHDLGLASSFCDDIHVMYAGRIVESGSGAAVLSTPAASLLGGSARLDLRARPRRRSPHRRDLGAAAATAPAAVRLSIPPALRLCAGGLHGRAAACGGRPRAGRGVLLPRQGGDGVSTTDMTPARIEPVREETLVVVDHLSRHFRLGGPRSRRIVKAVDDVSLVLTRGETVGLVGESGSGKSTLARLLLRLDEPTSGSVHFESTDLFGISRRELRRLRREMQIVFQDPYASLNKRKTVEQIVSFPLVVHDRSLSRKERSARVAELLELVGLRPDHARVFPRQLSGGQCQRVNIARALALNPKLVVLDEAVSAVDVSIQAQILNLLRDSRSSST